ncbi:hypothetical protein Bpfe_004856, partial [Biomphalaria pfeifferi]
SSNLRKSKSEDLKYLLDRKIKNPLTQRINFLHGLKLVVDSAAQYLESFMLNEMLQLYESRDNDNRMNRFMPKFYSQQTSLLTLQTFVNIIHDKDCSEEDLKEQILIPSHDVEILNESGTTSRCPCSNPIYLHYYNKMEKCLTKENVVTSSKYLKNRQSFRNKRTFFHTVQKCVDALSDINLKEYSY